MVHRNRSMKMITKLSKKITYFCMPILFFSILVFLAIPMNVYEPLISYANGQTGENTEQSIPQDRVKSYTALSLENGQPIKIANATGKVIILNSWATWCIPCKEEMPGFNNFTKNTAKMASKLLG